MIKYRYRTVRVCGILGGGALALKMKTNTGKSKKNKGDL